MKECSVCKISKSPELFYVKIKATGRLHSQCKLCYAEKRKSFMAEHYRKYGEQYRLRARTRRARVKQTSQNLLLEYLNDKACEMCGLADIRVLDFDHTEPSTKKFSIARGVNEAYAWETILAEIKKCRILCSNCHRIRTAEQYSWYKWRVGRGV